MNRMVHKLKSRSGATIVFAMAVFVLVSIVSVSMITVPLNAAALGKSQQEAEQIRLSLSSAAGLVRDCVVDKTLSYKWEWTKEEEKDNETALADKINTSGTTVTFGGRNIDDADIFPLLWKEMTTEIITENETEAEAKSEKIVTIQLTGSPGDASLTEKLGTVTVKLMMNDRYHVTAEFSVTFRGKEYTIRQFFGAGEIGETNNDDESVKVDEETGEVVSVEYHYEGSWAISWPLENYRVNA